MLGGHSLLFKASGTFDRKGHKGNAVAVMCSDTAEACGSGLSGVYLCLGITKQAFLGRFSGVTANEGHELPL